MQHIYHSSLTAAPPLMLFAPPPVLANNHLSQLTPTSSNARGQPNFDYQFPTATSFPNSNSFYYPQQYYPQQYYPQQGQQQQYCPQQAQQLIHPVVLSYLHPPVSDKHYFNSAAKKGVSSSPRHHPPTATVNSNSPDISKICNYRLRYGDCFHKGNCKPFKRQVKNLTTTPLPQNFQAQGGPLRHFQSHRQRLIAQRQFLQKL